MYAWQPDFFGGKVKTLSWKDIIRRCVLEIGERPDLDETEYRRKVAGRVFTKLPAVEQLVKAIIQKGEVEYGLKLIEQFYQLPSTEVPAPDTIARQTREALNELKDEGIIISSNNNQSDVTFAELIAGAEHGSGH